MLLCGVGRMEPLPKCLYAAAIQTGMHDASMNHIPIDINYMGELFSEALKQNIFKDINFQ